MKEARVAIEPTDLDYASTAVPPGALFVAADEPLLVYPSVLAAERHLEAKDVEDGVYPAAYGPKGEPYSVRSERSRVIIEPTGGPNSPDELIPLLLRYLEATGRSPGAKETFEDLVAAVWTVERDFWQTHDPYGDRFGTRISCWGGMAFVVLVVITLFLFFR